MLIQNHRPKTFKEMEGVDLPKKVLTHIAKNPSKSIRSLIFSGSWGTGKTSAARIFAKAINCKSKTGDACNECSTCNNIGVLYTEFDSAMVGNVDEIKRLRDTFSYSVVRGYRIIVFDECHLISKQAQGVLLKVLEEASPNVTFIFPTTDIDHLLKTILSRSLVLEFDTLTDFEIGELIEGVSQSEGINVSPDIINIIKRRVGGHARDALQYLELYSLLGGREFIERLMPLNFYFKQLFNCYRHGKNKDARDIIIEILKKPVLYVRQDFESLLWNLSDMEFLSDKPSNPVNKHIIFTYLKYQKYLQTSTDWFLFLSSLSTHFIKRESSNIDRFKK